MKTKNEYDVVVVGGGPAGSTTAMFLADRGYDVLLADRASFPRDKPCGDAISGKSAGQLAKLGLIKHVEKYSATIRGVVFSSPEGRLLDVAIPPGHGVDRGYCSKRIDYDNILFRAARKKEM